MSQLLKNGMILLKEDHQYLVFYCIHLAQEITATVFSKGPVNFLAYKFFILVQTHSEHLLHEQIVIAKLTF